MPIIPINIAPVSDDYCQEQSRLGRTREYIEAAWQHNFVYEQLRTQQAGQAILDYCHQKGYCEPLTFERWGDSNVISHNGRGTTHVVVGSYNGGKYILRGIVKRRRRKSDCHWFLNGQASTGAVQVAHIAENDSVVFEQVEAIINRYLTIFNQTHKAPR